jgi:hypothetical protein
MTFKQNRWYSFGDVNPREHGGVFVKRDGDEIETVSTDNMSDVGQTGYQINRRSDYVSDLKVQWEQFKQDPDNARGVAASMDWKRYLENEMDWDTLVLHLAVDMIGYWGSSCEIETGTNYWEMLKIDGISYRNI